MTAYQRYLADEVLPLEPAEARKIKKNSSKYTLIDGNLFRHGLTHPILVCVDGEQYTRIMAELHEGICGSHISGRSLSSKGHSCRVLLANHEEGLHEVRLAVQAVRTTC